MSFCNFTQGSEDRQSAGKLSFPRLLPKDTVGRYRGTGRPSTGPGKEHLAGCFFISRDFKTMSQRKRELCNSRG